MFSLIIGYCIDNGIYSAIITIIINVITDKSRLFYKITIKIDKTYRILNYTRVKPRSKPPPKKSAYFTHPDFSVAKLEKRCANYASKYGSCFTPPPPPPPPPQKKNVLQKYSYVVLLTIQGICHTINIIRSSISHKVNIPLLGFAAYINHA
jgi:hypothetical protein